MGIFDLFRNKFKGAGPQDKGGMTTRRLHARYMVTEPNLCYLGHADFGSFEIVDISFMACYVELLKGPGFASNIQTANLRLNCLGQSFEFTTSSIQRRRDGWVVAFEHTHEKSLLELGQILEPIRCGSTAVEAPIDYKKSVGLHSLRKRYYGDGPFDLVVERDKAGEISFAMITLRQNDVYTTTMLEGSDVVTKKNIDKQGVGARMAQTQYPDHKIIFTAATACMGMKFSDGPEVAHHLMAWLEKHARQEPPFLAAASSGDF